MICGQECKEIEDSCIVDEIVSSPVSTMFLTLIAVEALSVHVSHALTDGPRRVGASSWSRVWRVSGSVALSNCRIFGAWTGRTTERVINALNAELQSRDILEKLAIF
ncbi:hypothetical protein HRR83_000144 [Exophiala dermatitidis]|uniref:Uncharacterized protein n=1 Tax=Exophiala dermatitidis TaxID=5970 RepID=A0AAN6J2D4_EXODE|nr:hypothetical protein HRR73_002680 [Exophiala dermatitidis]KAJ4527392.1 hypothetical protein HRR74_000145 [Exophiala dermatitidis]KAJ4530954.1 hypothetical protein HRR76_008642 [Exophiala dermatitidis]KAJ4558124.1 hypothetical protein HRR77_000146 [Exophiala dermatitidis]KAJ4581846.1 hypothetical protein HRR79_000851 [Exophiala dermatitidis]